MRWWMWVALRPASPARGEEEEEEERARRDEDDDDGKFAVVDVAVVVVVARWRRRREATRVEEIMAAVLWRCGESEMRGRARQAGKMQSRWRIRWLAKLAIMYKVGILVLK